MVKINLRSDKATRSAYLLERDLAELQIVVAHVQWLVILFVLDVLDKTVVCAVASVLVAKGALCVVTIVLVSIVERSKLLADSCTFLCRECGNDTLLNVVRIPNSGRER